MSEQSFLILLLDAPMMSWGVSSRFQRRATELHPSRSAISGMICAAMGVDKGSTEESGLLLRMEGVRFSFYAIPRVDPLRDSELPIRRLEDFHTVSGTRSADNPRPKKDAVLSHRQYLVDARFVAVLAGEEPLLAEIAAALGDPVWGIWLGRKSCIPAHPIAPFAVRSTLAEALADAGLDDESVIQLNSVRDAATFPDGTDTVMDLPVNFSTREFKPRRIVREPGKRK